MTTTPAQAMVRMVAARTTLSVPRLVAELDRAAANGDDVLDRGYELLDDDERGAA